MAPSDSASRKESLQPKVITKINTYRRQSTSELEVSAKKYKPKKKTSATSPNRKAERQNTDKI
jgi:hypothetical protein